MCNFKKILNKEEREREEMVSYSYSSPIKKIYAYSERLLYSIAE